MSKSKVMVWVFGLLFIASSVNATTIAYWQFEPGNLLLDSSGNGNVLANYGVTSSGDVALDAPGSGSALFNGTSVIATFGALDLTPYAQLTIEWFMKPNISSTAIAWVQTDNLYTSAGAVGSYINEIGSGLVEAGINANGAADFATNAVPDGVVGGAWHHYAVEIDTTDPTSSGVTLYIDGLQAGGFWSNGAGSSVALLNAPFNIGGNSVGAIDFAGNIDELRISSGLLSPNQFLNAVPETSTTLLLGLGGCLLAWRRRRQ